MTKDDEIIISEERLKAIDFDCCGGSKFYCKTKEEKLAMLEPPPPGYKYHDGYIDALGSIGLCYDGPVFEVENQEIVDYYDKLEQERHKPVKQFYKHFDKFRHRKKK